MAIRLVMHKNPSGRGNNPSRLTPVAIGSIAKRNRHTGKPHEHKREIARAGR